MAIGAKRARTVGPAGRSESTRRAPRSALLAPVIFMPRMVLGTGRSGENPLRITPVVYNFPLLNKDRRPCGPEFLLPRHQRI